MAASEDDVSGKAKQLEIAVPRPLGLGLPRSALDPIPTVAVFDEGHAAPTQIVQNGVASTERLLEPPARPGGCVLLGHCRGRANFSRSTHPHGARPARDGTSATSRNVTELRTPLLSALPFELLPERGYPRARHNCQLGSNPNASLWNSTQRRDTTSSASRASTSSDSLSLPRATDDDACQPVGARAEDRCLLEAAVEHQFACSEYRRGNQLGRVPASVRGPP